MATVNLATSYVSTTNGLSHITSSFTPVAGDLLVVIGAGTGTVDTNTTCTANANSITFTKIDSRLSDANTDVHVIYVADQLIPSSPSSMFITIGFPTDSTTGGAFAILAITGMSKTGSAAFKQAAYDELITGPGFTPDPSFASAATTSNPVVGWVTNNSNPAGMTPPTDFTELLDSGYGTPTSGYEVVYVNSGFTGTTVTWGNTSTRGYSGIFELDTSSAADTVVLPLLNASSTVITPLVIDPKTIALPVLSDDVTFFAPTTSSTVALNSLATTTSVFQPTTTEVKLIDSPLVTDDEVLFNPTVATINRIGIPLFWDPESIDQMSVGVPGSETVVTDLLQDLPSLHSPSTSARLTMPVLETTATIHSLQTVQIVALQRVNDPSVVHQVRLSMITKLQRVNTAPTVHLMTVSGGEAPPVPENPGGSISERPNRNSLPFGW